MKTKYESIVFFLIYREQRARQRYSVEVANAGNYLNIRPSTLETLNKSGQSSILNRRNRKTNVSPHFGIDFHRSFRFEMINFYSNF